MWQKMLGEVLSRFRWETVKASEGIRFHRWKISGGAPSALHILRQGSCRRQGWVLVTSRAAIAKQQPASTGQGDQQAEVQLAFAAQQLEAFLLESPIMHHGFLATAFLCVALLFFCSFLALAWLLTFILVWQKIIFNNGILKFYFLFFKKGILQAALKQILS